MLISHPRSLGLTPSHIVTHQEWTGLNLASQRERNKVGHYIHSPMTRSTKEQHTQRVLSRHPDAYLQS